MAENISKYDVLSGFGFDRNPFRGQVMETADMARVRRILKMAVADRALISIVGDRGIGKSVAVIETLKQMQTLTVKTWAVDKKRLLISDIEYALLHDLTEEPPKRMKEVRSLQLRRVLGENSRNRDIVLVIEEAHTMHHMTLRALKALRELAWAGQKELLSVVLIGQSDAMSRAGLSEVRLRSDTVRMGGLTPAECTRYTGDTLGEIVHPEAREKIAAIPECRNYLDLQSLLIRAMAQAMAAGRSEVLPEDIADLRGDAKPKPVPVARPKAAASGVAAVLARRNAETEGLRKTG